MQTKQASRSALAVACVLWRVAAAELLAEPPLVASARGSLEVMIVAREQRLVALIMANGVLKL